MKLLDKLKKLLDKLKQKNASNIQEEDFKNNILPTLNFGDIIWAYRYDYDWEVKSFTRGHDVGPFVVIDKTEDKLICCYCTSVNNKEGFFAIFENEDVTNKSISKTTYTSVEKVKTIDYESYISGYEKTSLSSFDKEKLMKKLQSSTPITYTDFGLIKTLNLSNNINYNIKDVVSYQDYYYVIMAIEKDNYWCLKIFNYDPNSSYLTSKTFPIGTLIKLDKSQFQYINTLEDSQYLDLLRLYNRYLDSVEENKKTKVSQIAKVGNIISVNNKLYYVYDNKKNSLFVFEIQKYKSNDSTCIDITGEKYIPYFDKLFNIDAYDGEYEIISIATDEEIEMIKTLKNSNHETNQKKNINKGKIINKIEFGIIVNSDLIYGLDFLALYTSGNSITTLSMDSLLSNKYVYRTFPIKDVRERKYLTIEEQNWLDENLEDLRKQYTIILEIQNIIYNELKEQEGIDIFSNIENYKIEFPSINNRRISKNEEFLNLVLEDERKIWLSYSVMDMDRKREIHRGVLNLAELIQKNMKVSNEKNNYSLKRKQD